jgi:uncharacterized protein
MSLCIDRALLVTLALGVAGGAVLGLAGMPGGWLVGAMVVVAIAALSGFKVRLEVRLSQFGFLVIGISMGAGVTPETIARLPSWPITMALVTLSVPLITGAVYLFLLRVAGWSRATALLSAMPGAMSYLMALAPSTDADVPRVAMLQTTRVAILVALLPLAAIWLGSPNAAIPALPVTLEQGLPLLVGGAGGALLAHLLGVPGGLMIGGLFVSALLHGSGLVIGRLPDWLAISGFVLLGTMIGTRFAGTSWHDLGKVILISLQAFAISISLAVALAVLAAWMTGLDLLKLLLAFAPGGLEAMVVLAFALDLDPAFVAAHHLARFLLIALCAPFVIKAFGLSTSRGDRPG